MSFAAHRLQVVMNTQHMVGWDTLEVGNGVVDEVDILHLDLKDIPLGAGVAAAEVDPLIVG